MPKWWTREEDDLLRAAASLGPDGVREQLLQAGYVRTISAITTRASRLGVTLLRYETCPLCGGLTEHLGKTGHCPVCEMRGKVQAEREKAMRIRRDLAAAKAAKSSAEYEAASREYAAARQENSRMRRRGTIKGR